MKASRSCLLLLLVFPISRIASAQVVAGTLQGTARDESGAPLASAVAILTSKALPSGSLSTETNERGQFRFLTLPPGIYRLTLRVEGFELFQEDGIRIQVGGTLERNVTLKLETFAESIVVTSEGPSIDPRESGVATHFDSVSIRRTPVPRFSVFDLIKSAPGVSATSPSTRQRNLSVLGAGINESTYLLDGTDITSPRYGIARPSPGTDIVEEVEVQAFGASAEYGNLEGGVINVVTRKGGDEFRIDASYYGQWAALTSKPILKECNCPQGESGFERDLYRDVNAYVGGPLARGRAWFYGGFNLQWDSSSQPGSNPGFPSRNEIEGASGKLDWQSTPRLKLMSTFHYDRWSVPDRTPNAFVPFESTSIRSGDSHAGTMAYLTYARNANTLWELRASTSSFTSGLTPANDSKTLPAHLDVASGVFSGGALYFGDTVERKTDVRAKLSRYAADFLYGDHDLKFGIQFSTAGSEGYYAYPGGVHYLDYEGQPFVARYRDTYSYGGAFDTLGVFAEDSVRVGSRLTLNLGARFDYSKARSEDVPAYDALGNTTGDTVAGRGFLYSWSVLSPRLGVNLALTGDARTILRAFYGRFHPGILTTELQAVSPGLGPITVASYDPATLSYSNVVSIVDPLANVGVDADTRSPHTDQFSLGFEREIGRDWSVAASYVRRSGSGFTGWKDIGGVYGTGVIALPDGRPFEVFPLQNDSSERFFLLTNREEYFIRHRAVLLTAQKRWSDGWQLLLSYSHSEARGLQSQNGDEPAGMQGSLTTSFNPFGRDPNDLTNATGILPTDRTHMLRAQGSAEIPKVEILVGVNFQYLTGRPFTAVANVTLPQGARPIFIEPLGSHRFSSQELLDLRLSKTLRWGSGSVELLADILNALNDTAEEGVATRNFFNPNFGVSTNFVPPRRAMVGVRLSF
jgi:Carboxypeptidase regulatory-like domain/TonB dependent receptor-like, beta-barrel/TonB-dependent Receptor Plug Domain